MQLRSAGWTSVMLAGAAVIVAVGVYRMRTAPRGERAGTPSDATPATPPSGSSNLPSAPIPGQPARDDLDRAITRGTQAFLREFVEPSYAAVSNGGYVDYVNAVGIKKRLGPKAYVAYQLYLLTHFLMYYHEFGIREDDPLLRNVRDWFLAEFDREQGRWLWSYEGCLHAKGMVALSEIGHSDLVAKAYEWALHSTFYLREHHMFSMMQSGDIIQSLGDATLSLTGRHGWEHGAPIPDAENSSKFLYALLRAGIPADDPRVADLRGGLRAYILSVDTPVAAMGSRDLVGFVWYVLATHRFSLDKDAAYERAIEHMTNAIERDWRANWLLVEVPSFRSLMVRALMTAGRRTPALDAQVNGFAQSQGANGVWPLPRVLKLWAIDRPPATGIKIGTMDGANTYLLTLCLIYYRDTIYAP